MERSSIFRRRASPDAPIPPVAPPDTRPSAQESAERLQQRINPVVARIIAATENKTLLHPRHTINTPQEVSNLGGILTNKKPEDISYTAVEALSEDKRSDYYRRKAQREKEAAEREGKTYQPKTFEENKEDWNASVATWILAKVRTNTDNKDAVLAVLNSVNMTIDEHTTENDLTAKINDFYDSYLNGKSKIKKFVADVAKDCRTGEAIWDSNGTDTPITIEGNPRKDHNGKEYVQTTDGTFVPLEQVTFPVDREKLQKRLTAVKGFLTVFDDTDDIPELVQDFATAHGELSQKKEERVKTIEAVKPHLIQGVPDGPERARLQALFTKEQQLAAVERRIFPDPDTRVPGEGSKERNDFVASAGADSQRDPSGDKGDVSNQDAKFSKPDRGAFGVFDGVGESPRADVASQTAHDFLSETLAQISDGLSLPETQQEVAEAMRRASQKIWELNRPYFLASKENYERKKGRQLTQEEINDIRLHTEMATTGAVVKIWKDPKSGERKAIIAHVGDSRIYYQPQNGDLQCQTLDDNALRDMFDEDEAQIIQDQLETTPEDKLKTTKIKLKATTLERLASINKAKKWRVDEEGARIKRPFKLNEEREVSLHDLSGIDAIMQTLSDESIDPHVGVLDVRPGGRILLTSDGIQDNLTLAQIQDILNEYQNDPQKAAEELVRFSQHIGKKLDDSTAVVVNI